MPAKVRLNIGRRSTVKHILGGRGSAMRDSVKVYYRMWQGCVWVCGNSIYIHFVCCILKPLYTCYMHILLLLPLLPPQEHQWGWSTPIQMPRVPSTVAGWKSIMQVNGAPSATHSGAFQTLLWPARCWDLLLQSDSTPQAPITNQEQEVSHPLGCNGLYMYPSHVPSSLLSPSPIPPPFQLSGCPTLAVQGQSFHCSIAVTVTSAPPPGAPTTWTWVSSALTVSGSTPCT